MVIGFSKSDEINVKLQVEENGGMISEEFSQSITHLICTPNRSNHSGIIQMITKKGIPLIDLDWINDTIDKYRATKLSNYLDRCCIYLDVERCEKEIIQLVRKATREGGGTFMSVCDSLTTHYIVFKELTKKDIAILNDLSHKPFVVSHTWLTECWRQKKAIAEDPFVIELPNLKENENKESEIKLGKNLGVNVSDSFVKKPSISGYRALFEDYVFTICAFTQAEVYFYSLLRSALWPRL